MKPLIATLSILVGCYFAAYSGRLLVLRNAGHTSLFKALDAVTGYLPYLSIAILLIVGIAAILRNAVGQSRALAIKLPLTLIIAVIPFAIHMAMYTLTYSPGPPPQRPFGDPFRHWNGCFFYPAVF